MVPVGARYEEMIFVYTMNNLNFALIRIECCNGYKDTPCRIVLIGVKDANIVSKKEILIDPEDEPFDFMTSGTQLEDLKGKGTFVDHWPEILSFIKDFSVLVSTADGYDTNVLYNAINRYKIACEPIQYLTAKNIIRRSISTCSYRFDELCEMLNVQIIDDMPLNLAINWYELIIKACREKDSANLIDFARDNNLILGTVSSVGHNKCCIKRVYKSKKKNEKDYDPAKFDKSNPFFDQNVVFTGTLSYFTKDEAKDYVGKIGGHPCNGLSKSTNFLVVGVQNPSRVGPDGLSEKQRQAIKYRKEGIDIEIITEQEYIDMMGLQDKIDWKKYVEDELDKIRRKIIK